MEIESAAITPTLREQLEDVDVFVRRDEVGRELEHEGELLEDPATDDLPDDGKIPKTTRVLVVDSRVRGERVRMSDSR